MSKIQITLAAARVNAGFTQEDVAEKFKVTKQTIINWQKYIKFPRIIFFYPKI